MSYDTKSSNQPLIMFILFILIIVGAVGYLKIKKAPTTKETVQEKKENINRTIEYETKGYYYEINQRNDVFEVIIKSDEDCETEDCTPSRVDNYKIEDENDLEDLKKLFNELFSDADSNKLKIERKDVSIDQATILDSILREPEEQVPVTYEILGPIDYPKLKETGYMVEEKDGKVLITIGMGEKPTGGYSIEIESVIANINNVTIHVKEHSPNPGDITTQAITCPAVQIELNVRPETLTISNKSTGKVYKEVKEKEENPDAELTYQIKSSSYNSNYKTRGYLLLEKYNKNILIIAMGERNTGGYSITVTKVEIKGNEATVYVKETSPELDAVTTQALTQPIAQVEFSKKPEKITVLDENGNKFEPIENER